MKPQLVTALEPFATFAETFIDAEGWSGPMRTERIVDWFGPSDFRRAAEALATWKTGSADEVSIPRSLFDFLRGASQIDDAWFGDSHTTMRGRFWWRNLLAACDTPPSTEDAS